MELLVRIVFDDQFVFVHSCQLDAALFVAGYVAPRHPDVERLQLDTDGFVPGDGWSDREHISGDLEAVERALSRNPAKRAAT